MQRCKLYALFQRLDNFLCDQYGLCVLFACMYDSVANCTEVSHGFHNTMLRILDRCQYLCNRILMVFHRHFGLNFFLSDLFVTDNGTVHTDSLYQALAEQVFVCHVQNLIL